MCSATEEQTCERSHIGHGIESEERGGWDSMQLSNDVLP